MCLTAPAVKFIHLVEPGCIIDAWWVGEGGCGGGAGCCVEYSLNILQRRACFSTFPCLNISRPGGETVVGGGGFRSDFHTLLFFSAAVKGEEGARQATAASNKQDEAMCVRVFEVGLRSVSTPVSPPPPSPGFFPLPSPSVQWMWFSGPAFKAPPPPSLV